MRQNSMAYGKNKFQKEEKISPPKKRSRKHHVSNHKNAPNHQRKTPQKKATLDGRSRMHLTRCPLRNVPT